jgi:hypothetical protein
MGRAGCRRPRFKELNPAQKTIDHEARLTISMELKHDRAVIVAVYVGK